jgi:hypothetical protein
MAIITLLSQISSVASAVVAVVLQEKWHDKRTTLHKRVVMIFVGLMLLSGILSGATAWMGAKESTELRSRIGDLQADQRKLTDQVVTLSKDNARLSQNTVDSITGGSSFCWYIYSQSPYDSLSGDTFLTILHHEGQYALRELYIQIFDSSMKNIWEAENIYKPLFYTPKAGIGQAVIDTLKLPPDKDSFYVDITFTALNGSWYEEVDFRRVNHVWKTAMRVTKDGRKTIIKEVVDPNFPRDSGGNVMWLIPD